MGICLRRPHERVLSLLPDLVSCSVVLGSHHPEKQVDMFVRVQHTLSSRVCHSGCCERTRPFSHVNQVCAIHLRGLLGTQQCVTAPVVLPRSSSNALLRSSAVPCTHRTSTGPVASPFHRIHSVVGWVQCRATCITSIFWFMTV